MVPDFRGLRDLWHRCQASLFDLLIGHSAGIPPHERWKNAGLLTLLTHDLLRIRRSYVNAVLQERLGLSLTISQELSRRVFRNFFRNVLEMTAASRFSPEQVLGSLEADGFEHIERARDEGRGGLLLTAHYGVWELIPHWLTARGISLTSVARRQKNVHIDRIFDRLRTAHGARITDSGFGLREILRTLRSGHFLGLLIDQNAGDQGIFVPFFGRPASTVAGPAAIAQKAGCPLIPLVAHPRASAPHHLEILPPIRPQEYPSGPEGREAMTQAFTSVFARWIARRPEQWFWLHRRWKTPPPPTSSQEVVE